jgi:hypothetical protein
VCVVLGQRVLLLLLCCCCLPQAIPALLLLLPCCCCYLPKALSTLLHALMPLLLLWLLRWGLCLLVYPRLFQLLWLLLVLKAIFKGLAVCAQVCLIHP